jgi:hypothetical protein
MMRRLARPYAVIGLVAALVGGVGAITLRIVDPVPIIPDTLGFSDLALVGFEFLGVMFASVGALLVVRRPENAVGWLMVLIGAGNALAGLTGAVTVSAVADGPAGAATAGFAGWLTVLFVMIGALVIGLGFIFPTGRGHTPGWDRLNRIGAVIFLSMLVVLILFRPGPLQVFASIDNPFGFGPDVRSVLGPQISTLIAGSGLVFVPFLVLSIVSRYRMSDPVGRQQLKWFILALLVTQGGIAVAAIGAVMTDEPPAAGLVVFGFAGALVPVAIGIAILRHGLYDIDRIISRTIAYGAVTGILGAVFVGTILALQAVLAPFMKEQTIAVAASTLAVFVLFQPLRRRVQGAVDRRFDRARYDADQTVRTFAARLRGDFDLITVSAEIVGTASSAVRPTTAGIWLRGSSR